jgi:dTDP-glucose 4,6-dehydratase
MFSEERYPVNLGNPLEMTILEFAERIRDHMGNDIPIVYHPMPEDDPKRRQPDISKAKAVLGWEPRVSLDEGLRETVEFSKQALDAAAVVGKT